MPRASALGDKALAPQLREAALGLAVGDARTIAGQVDALLAGDDAVLERQDLVGGRRR